MIGILSRKTTILKNKIINNILDNPRLFKFIRFFTAGPQIKTKQMLKRELDIKKDENILDVCCGIGDFAEITTENYAGIDLNKKFVKYASKQYSGTNKKFIWMDILNLKFDRASFDKAVFINSLHHFSNKEIEKILTDLARIVKEKIIIIDAEAEPRNWLRRMLIKNDRGKFIRTFDEQKKLIENYLNILKFEVFNSGLFVEQTMFVCRSK